MFVPITFEEFKQKNSNRNNHPGDRFQMGVTLEKWKAGERYACHAIIYSEGQINERHGKFELEVGYGKCGAIAACFCWQKLS